jgi:hypothetical protein
MSYAKVSLNKDTAKLLLPNQWAEVNQAFLENCLVILEKEVIDTSRLTGLLVSNIKKSTKP